MVGQGTASRGDRTRLAIVAAARERFAADGYARATGARIAADVGISEPTITHHFGSKAGLLVAVMQDFYDDLLERMEVVLGEPVPPRERLERFARWWLAHNAAHFALVAEFGREGRRSEPDAVVAAFRASNRRVTGVFERLVVDLQHGGVLRADVPARVVRDVFFGGCEHVLVGRALTGRPADLDAAAAALLDLLVVGAAAREDEVDDDASDGGGANAGGPELASLDAKLDRLLTLVERVGGLPGTSTGDGTPS